MTPRLILIMLLLLSSGPAYAEWVEVSDSNTLGGYVVYADPGTIRRKGALVKMWNLYDYKTVQTVADSAYLSARTQIEYDCTKERSRLLALTWFSGNMGKS